MTEKLSGRKMNRIILLTSFFVFGSFFAALPCPGQKLVPVEQEAETDEKNSKTDTSIQAKFLDEYTVKVSQNGSSKKTLELVHYDLERPDLKLKRRIWEFDVCRSHNLIATAGRDGTLRLWDAKTGAPRRILLKGGEDGCDHGYIWSVTFSPNGELLAAASYTGQVFLFKTKNLGLLVKTEELKTSDQNRRTVKFSDDGKVLNVHYANHRGEQEKPIGKMNLQPWLSQLKTQVDEPPVNATGSPEVTGLQPKDNPTPKADIQNQQPTQVVTP